MADKYTKSQKNFFCDFFYLEPKEPVNRMDMRFTLVYKNIGTNKVHTGQNCSNMLYYNHPKEIR